MTWLAWSPLWRGGPLVFGEGLVAGRGREPLGDQVGEPGQRLPPVQAGMPPTG